MRTKKLFAMLTLMLTGLSMGARAQFKAPPGGGTDPGIGTSAPITATAVTIAGNGSGNWLNGKTWDATANEMAYANGIYFITFTNVPAGDGYEFKFCRDKSWTVSYGYSSTTAIETNKTLAVGMATGEDTNIKFAIAEASNITISFSLTDLTFMISTTGIVVGDDKAPATYTAKMAEDTEDKDNWTIEPAEGLTEGQTVTLTYSGTRRVKSVTATVKQPVAVAFNNDNRNNYIQKDNYFRCQLYNPWDGSTAAINPADLQLKKGERLSVTFRLAGFNFTQAAKMVLCCNFGSESGWEPDCFGYSRTVSVGSNGTYTVSWTNDTGAAVAWSSASALTMAMQYEGYASLSDTSAAGLKAACEIVSIVIE